MLMRIIPLTLLHEKDAEDNLLHQKELGIEFASYEEMTEEIDRLLADDEYREIKERGLRKGYVTQEELSSLYADVIEKHHSPYRNRFEVPDTDKFRKEYLKRLNQSKNLAILGAGIFQLPLIEKAREMGLITHVFSCGLNDPGRKTADFFYPISTMDREKLLDKCLEIGIDGICSIASDAAVPALNYISSTMGLCGNSSDATGKTTNKRLMRMALKEGGDSIPAYETAGQNLIIDTMPADFPVIVKPTDRSGSRGVTKVYNRAELENAIKKAIDESFEKKAIIEEFLEGHEYSVEHISFRGKHELVAITRKFTTGEPNFIEVSHHLPAELDEKTVEKIKIITEHALDTLEIGYGASHCEIIIGTDGEIRIVEVGARMGGDFIGSHLAYYGAGIDYLKCVIDVALGEEPDLRVKGKPFPVKSVFMFTQQDFNELERIKKHQPEKLISIPAYQPENIGRTTDSSNRCGCYIARA